MNKRAGNIILFTAMAAMLLPSLYSNVLQLKRCVAKMIAHEKLEAGQLTTIRIAVSDLEWYEEGRELFYHEQLFDVESFIIENDTAIIRGLTDARETEINVAVNKLLQNTAVDFVITTIGKNIIQFTGLQPSTQNFAPLTLVCEKTYRDWYSIPFLASIYSPIHTPPPDISFS